ncbi:Heme peroxidase [Dirofilaria immitis]
MLLWPYIWVLLQVIIHFGYGDKTLQEESIDDMLLKATSDARQVINELEQHHVLSQGISVMDQIQLPFKIWGLHTRSELNIRKLAHAAFISIIVTKKLKNGGIKSASALPVVLKYIQEYCPLYEIKCFTSKYRTIDGTCNNIVQSNWGAIGMPMQRIIEPFYADGVDELRASIVDGSELPNVRYLSNLFFVKKYLPKLQVNMLVAFWAHFVYTDLVHVESIQLLNDEEQIPLSCCTLKIEQSSECKSIVIPKNNPDFNDFLNCIPYMRTAPAPRSKCELGPREQVNQVTSFLDASVIYGSTIQQARALRTFRNGLLLTSSNSLNQNMPPTIDLFYSILRTTAESHLSTKYYSFTSGSDRINFLQLVTVLHIIWIRQHNRIATNLKTINPRWSDEQLYQESRRIVIAQLQHITYNEFLPMLISKENWLKFRLQPQSYGYSKEYNPSVNPTAINTYAAVVGQFFFTMFGKNIALYQDDNIKILERPLNEYFSDSGSLFSMNEIKGILKYLLREPINGPTLHMNDEFRNKFFKEKENLGYDLAALILQIGRDHGIPPYIVWREYCGGSKIQSFDDLMDDLIGGIELVKELANIYKAVDDMDLFILGLAEKPIHGALLGPTFSCITKEGDRFWYENELAPSGFTEEQLIEIRKTTMAKILCNNVEYFDILQPRVFELENKYDNYPINCNKTLQLDMDLNEWYDEWYNESHMINALITKATIEKAIEVAVEEVKQRRKRERRTIRENQNMFKSGDPLLSYSKMMRAKHEAIAIARVSDVFLQVTKNIMSSIESEDNKQRLGKMDANKIQDFLQHIDVSSFISRIEPFLGPGGSVEKCLPKNLPCDDNTPYRTMSGWCNNLRNPHFANAFGPLIHLLPPAYENGIDMPRSKSVTGELLPSPRLISNAIHFDLPIDHQKYSHMIMQFGQILDHEVTHSPIERGPDNEILNCTRCDSHETLSMHCMPLPVPSNDPFFPTHDQNGERRCLPFARSLLGQLNLGYRNQINQLTAFLDGSAVYGSTECEAKELRTFVGGRLNSTNLGIFNSEALPQGDQEQDCRSSPEFMCFVAGDERNSHQPGLTSMHNIFLREHNRIARKLEKRNPSWDDERIFQETRRIVGAEFAHITYNEYLPLLLGNRLMRKYDLNTLKIGYYQGYDDKCDASISHPFSTAAFRFGHTLVRRFFSRFNTYYENFTEPVDLVENFNSVEAIYDGKRGSIDSLLVGLLGTPAMAFDRHITTALRNHLFGRRGEPFSGMDLISLNILRARDHGVQPYNAFRKLCGIGAAKDFSDLLNEMNESAVIALKSLYKSVDDIDLFPGLLCERPIEGALLPPTMACIIAEQFHRTKKCDRFYYENDLYGTRFSPNQLTEIRKVTLASLLCANSQFLKIQPNVFLLPDELVNAPISCTHLKHINLDQWIDRPLCYVGNIVISFDETKRVSPCQSCTCTTKGSQCATVTIKNCIALFSQYLLTEIMKDTSCIVQCAHFFWKST